MLISFPDELFLFCQDSTIQQQLNGIALNMIVIVGIPTNDQIVSSTFRCMQRYLDELTSEFGSGLNMKIFEFGGTVHVLIILSRFYFNSNFLIGILVRKYICTGRCGYHWSRRHSIRNRRPSVDFVQFNSGYAFIHSTRTWYCQHFVNVGYVAYNFLNIISFMILADIAII